MGVTKESALDLKRTALALNEADQHLRTAGDTTEGVVEAAAEDYIDKCAAHEAALEKVKGEHEADPGDAPHVSEAAEVAAAEAPEEAKQPDPPESDTEIQGHETSDDSKVTRSVEKKDEDKSGDGDGKTSKDTGKKS